MEKEKSCGAIVIDNGKVLIVKQISGFYGFPKGHMNANEEEEITARREVKEETNIDVIINNKYRYTSSYFIKDNVLKEVVFFLARPITTELRAEEREIEEAKWVPYTEAFNLITYDDSKRILDKLLAELKQSGEEI